MGLFILFEKSTMNLHNPEMMQNNFSATQTLAIAESSANFDPIFRPEFLLVLQEGQIKVKDMAKKPLIQESTRPAIDMDFFNYL